MTTQPSHRRSRKELLDALEEQLQFLQASSRAFDAGVEAEALRIAGVIRVLVHETSTSKSLLGQLGVKTRLRFPQTANLDPRHGMWRMQLWHDGTSVRGCYVPIGHERVAQAPAVPFGHWWEQLVVHDAMGNEFTRKQLILMAANKDGHAHVDPMVPQGHADLTLRNSAGWAIANNGGASVPFGGNPLRVMVRQIGIEVEAAVLHGQRWFGRKLSRYHTPYIQPARGGGRVIGSG